MKKYVVIGGQYEPCYYGESDTLRGARIISGRRAEYWDNWSGWRRPAIYRAEDCETVTARGMLTVPDGHTVTRPKLGAEPIT